MDTDKLKEFMDRFVTISNFPGENRYMYLLEEEVDELEEFIKDLSRQAEIETAKKCIALTEMTDEEMDRIEKEFDFKIADQELPKFES